MNGVCQLDVSEIVPDGVEVTELDLAFGGMLLLKQNLRDIECVMPQAGGRLKRYG